MTRLHVRARSFEVYFNIMRGNENSQKFAFCYVVCDSSTSFQGELTKAVCGLESNLRDVTLPHDLNLCQNKHKAVKNRRKGNKRP